jgi:hypothetical protein
MKRLVLSAMLVFCFASPSFVFAQALRGDHIEAGAFVDYFRVDRTDPSLNYAGLGGRLAFNLRPSVQLEAEMPTTSIAATTTHLTTGQSPGPRPTFCMACLVPSSRRDRDRFAFS